MRVEPATTADVDAVVDAWVALAGTQREHGSHIGASSNRETVRPLLSHHVVAGSVLVARAEESGDVGGGERGILGFTNFGIEEGALDADAVRGIVYNLYVVAEARGEGVGSALLDAAEDALIERGADVLAIEALWANEDARRLYEERGYEPHRVQFEREVEGDGEPKTGENDTNSRGGT